MFGNGFEMVFSKLKHAVFIVLPHTHKARIELTV